MDYTTIKEIVENLRWGLNDFTEERLKKTILKEAKNVTMKESEKIAHTVFEILRAINFFDKKFGNGVGEIDLNKIYKYNTKLSLSLRDTQIALEILKEERSKKSNKKIKAFPVLF